MAAREILLDSTDPHFTVQVQLDGSSYTLELEWLEGAQAWFVSLLNPTAEPVLSGLKVVVDWPFTWRYRTRGVPPGQLVFLADGDSVPPGRLDLGSRVKLYYVDAAGVNA
jgi:hypothetical protein